MTQRPACLTHDQEVSGSNPDSAIMNIKILDVLKSEDKKRFLSRVPVGNEDECWNWCASCDQEGYGRFSSNGKKIKAHRTAWVIFNNKEIPQGLHVLHHCDNPSCCNPNHLFLGTDLDNSNDKISKGRNKVSDQKGEVNGNSKLTESDVIEIRSMYSSGEFTYKELAHKFDVHLATIALIAKRKNWTHI